MRQSNRKIVSSLFVFLMVSFPLFSLTAETFTGKVVEISDGDTMSVMRGGQAVKVLLHGIDCPEKKQAFGTRPKRFTSEMAFGMEVEIRVQTTDRYDRIVRKVILPAGISLNEHLIYVGLA